MRFWMRCTRISSTPSISAEFEKHKPPTAKELVIERTAKIVAEIIPDATEEQIRKVSNRLNNDRQIAKAMRSAKTE